MTDFKGQLLVAVIGKTNAGKSTLVNALVGEKVSIISPKKQTTRENILGILNDENYQIVFIDTPGIHKTKNILDKSMMKQVRVAKEEADLVLFVVDSEKPFDQEEFETISNMAKNTDVYLLLSKVDKSGYEKVYPLIDKFSKIKEIVEIIPISAVKNINIDKVLSFLEINLQKCSEDETMYDRETYTDKSVRFMCEELIREQCLNQLGDEIPHGIFVEIKKFEEGEDLVSIEADISCKRNNHKSIIIGKQGLRLKNISTNARIEIEKLLGVKVFLKLYVYSREK